jgi:hypothetical protein
MEKKQIASLGCKFLGIYAIIQSIPLLGNVFQVFAFAKDDSSFGASLLISAFLPFLLMAFFGFELLFFSNKFAKKMVPANDSVNSDNILSSKDLQVIAFSIVGLFMIVHAIPKIFQIAWNVHALQSAGDQRDTQELLRQNWSFTLATGIQFLIGLFLFIGSELLSSGWHFIRREKGHILNIKYSSTIFNF